MATLQVCGYVEKDFVAHTLCATQSASNACSRILYRSVFSLFQTIK